MSRREITRIEPRSAVRIGFFLGLVVGLLFGLYSAAVLKGLSDSGMALLGDAETAQLKELGGISTVLLLIISALLGALFHSLIGGLCAIVYNLSARFFGGIEYHVQELGDSVSTGPNDRRDDD